jgi:hypothetical protein
VVLIVILLLLPLLLASLFRLPLEFIDALNDQTYGRFDLRLIALDQTYTVGRPGIKVTRLTKLYSRG